MRAKIVVAIAVVALLAGALVWTSRREEGRQRGQRAAARLPAFDDRNVTGFTLDTRAGGSRFARRDGRWAIVAPIDDLASASAVERLLAAARQTPIVQSLATSDAPSSYGLDPPVARLSLEGVTVPALELGTVSPTGESLFARLAGQREILLLHLPEAEPLVEPSVQKLREGALLDLARSEISGVTIGAGPGPTELRREKGDWWIVAPRRLPADADAVDRLLGAVYAAQIVGWEDTGAATDPRFGLTEPELRLAVHAGETTRSLTIGREASPGKRFAASDARKPVLVVSGIAVAGLPHDVEALRGKSLTNVNRYRVRRVSCVAGDRKLIAQRAADGTWTSDAGTRVPTEHVLTLLVGWLSAPIRGTSDGAPSGASSGTMEYETDDGAAGRITIEGTRAAWSAAPGTVFLLAMPPPAP